jgi:hypothetical protein
MADQDEDRATDRPGVIEPRSDEVGARVRARLGELLVQLEQAQDVIEQLATRLADAENRAARAEEALTAAEQAAGKPRAA